jgi:hypothetical protein
MSDSAPDEAQHESVLHRRAPRRTDVLDRYRPAALAVAAILGVVHVLPGAQVVGLPGPASSPLEQGSDAVETPAAIGAPEPLTLTAGPGTAVEAPLAVDLPEPLPVDLGAGEQSYSPPTAAPPPASRRPDVPGDPGPAPDAVPLTVATNLWVTRTAGTPLDAHGVPDATLPVGSRATLPDKVSFVRLAGTATALVLTEDPDGTRGDAAAAVVAACQVLEDDWQPGEAASFEDAPTYDAAACVAGVRDEQGSWTFDLASFPETRTAATGFALVPGGDAPLDVQVAFRRAPAPTPAPSGQPLV